MTYKLNGREVEIAEKSLEVGEGVYVHVAYYVDTGEDLNETELEQLADKYQSELYEDAYSDMVCAAEDLFDSINDR